MSTNRTINGSGIVDETMLPVLRPVVKNAITRLRVDNERLRMENASLRAELNEMRQTFAKLDVGIKHLAAVIYKAQ